MFGDFFDSLEPDFGDELREFWDHEDMEEEAMKNFPAEWNDFDWTEDDVLTEEKAEEGEVLEAFTAMLSNGDWSEELAHELESMRKKVQDILPENCIIVPNMRHQVALASAKRLLDEVKKTGKLISSDWIRDDITYRSVSFVMIVSELDLSDFHPLLPCFVTCDGIYVAPEGKGLVRIALRYDDVFDIKGPKEQQG